jgi:(S)-2-hydroxyglutarate dehydrogenase
MQTTDYLIIGAGILGLTVARELQRRDSGAKVTVVDKESVLGMHASGRNSGVLHSGIYYPSDTLKARFTREGNQAWQAYCEGKKIPIDRCGKLIVARNANEHEELETLKQRGAANGIDVQRLDLNQVHELEPRAKTFKEALFVPLTATANPLQLLAAQQEDFILAGGALKLGFAYRKKETGNLVLIGHERISAGKVINCAGLYADSVAHDFGFGLQYTLLPFKGLYHYSSRESQPPRCHIYPVPNLKYPFLGVHFTRTLDGRTKIGPTAMPALWREHYDGFNGFTVKELAEVGARELHMLVTNQNRFRTLVWQEIRKYRRKNMIDDAASMMEGTEAMGFNEAGIPGIRAQLVERRTNALVMDFVVEGDSNSTHVLNAISPAWTCALPFAAYLVDFSLQSN